MTLIKRYRNRRLYDTSRKSFIILSDLDAMIRRDEPITVIDTATGKDITLTTLTAVIGESVHGWHNPAASKALLQAAIKLGGEKSMSILKNTVLAGIGFAELTKKKAEELVESLIKIGEVSKSEKKKAVLELLAKAEKGTREVTGKLSKEVEKGLKKISIAKKTDIDALSKKVDKLARAIAKIEKKL